MKTGVQLVSSQRGDILLQCLSKQQISRQHRRQPSDRAETETSRRFARLCPDTQATDGKYSQQLLGVYLAIVKQRILAFFFSFFLWTVWLQDREDAAGGGQQQSLEEEHCIMQDGVTSLQFYVSELLQLIINRLNPPGTLLLLFTYTCIHMIWILSVCPFIWLFSRPSHLSRYD